jgi:hypothetical protein
MGQGQSSVSVPLPPPPPPAPGPPIPVVNLPLQRVPVEDGSSGLHYSGRIYTNTFAQMSTDICKGATVNITQVGEVFPNGVSSVDIAMDDKTHRINASALQTYVTNLISTGKVPGEMSDMTQQIAADKAFYESVQSEYCFYESRYKAALQNFLMVVSDQRGADNTVIQKDLQVVIGLNRRLNSLLEVLMVVSNDRARKVQGRETDIMAANKTIQDQVAVLRNQREFLQSSDIRTRTQEEMMRFSAEKNRAMSNQIMFFVALNVVALGTIFTVYQGMGPGGPL